MKNKGQLSKVKIIPKLQKNRIFPQKMKPELTD